MITFNRACEVITKTVTESEKNELINTENCIGRILSKNYLSDINLPRINLSSMDGAAILFNEKKKILKISGESKAGDKLASEIKKGECQLIYTGAPVKGENKKIIPKENFEIKNGHIYIKTYPNADFIRKKGSDLKKKNIYLYKKELITLRTIGLGKSMKLKKLSVKSKPKIFVICTGDEILNHNGKSALVTSTNNIFIKNLVEIFGGEVVKIIFSRDTKEDFIKKFNSEKNFNILITSGGISRGKYDIVKNSLKEKGLKIYFDRVAIKPGKPTTFGKVSKNKYFLGLPGNPISCYMSMINFFPIFINSFYGTKHSRFTSKEFVSKKFIEKNKNLTLFNRVAVDDKFFKVFDNQDSSMLHILKKANGILIRKPYAKEIHPNEKKKIILLNNFYQI